MKLQCFAVYDNKAQAFAHPYFAHNVALGVRAFANGANDPSTMLNRNPVDFALFHLAEWDDQLGTFTPVVPSTNLGLAANFVTPSTQGRLFGHENAQ